MANEILNLLCEAEAKMRKALEVMNDPQRLVAQGALTRITDLIRLHDDLIRLHDSAPSAEYNIAIGTGVHKGEVMAKKKKSKKKQPKPGY